MRLTYCLAWSVIWAETARAAPSDHHLDHSPAAKSARSNAATDPNSRIERCASSQSIPTLYNPPLPTCPRLNMFIP